MCALDLGPPPQPIGAGNVLGLVADGDLDALVAQPADIGALGSIRALHGVAEIAQYLGDAAHADTADPDEVDGSDLARQSPGVCLDVLERQRVGAARRPMTGSAVRSIIPRSPKIQISRAEYWMPRFRGA